MQLRNGTVVAQNVLQLQSRPLFEEGARLIFSKWTALALAVENQWGGSNSAEKADLLLHDCLDWFYNKREHYVDELEENLDDAILQDFNLEAEDGSPHQVADALVKLHNELVAGSTTYLEQLRSMGAAGTQRSKRQVVDLDGTVVAEGDAGMETSDEEDEDEDEDDEMEAEGAGGQQAPRAMPLEPPVPRGPVVDEDGFTMVQGKGRRGKR
ncbi:hypothetical protein VOLCADRAFT_96752 [Volvox carteri f. nagariensis]|uniref:Pre-rRNA-processing protein TSR2 n=1 Tax=Volvox carteri f. nagariensis TaxID=3068 RepID=D8UAY6_VOLCA|nr:uncharacterized protein VOLCADRAFT_96752 [Volvox carteri f. nagariensis]EFJ43017.1 hypothetical protein VOLCADRAFT_96752 [Volvox carteri f. nagariensis]|eukprot:XP_002955816.1 hypothetical protein VOLCADRAFT_96752 [Volvox carteri f. nagariensis]